MWDAVIAALGREASRAGRVILPGHGLKPLRPVEADFESCVDLLADELRAYGPVTLVGYSLGARVALALSVRHPSVVRSAMLIGVNPGLDDDDERTQRQRWDDEQANTLITQGVSAFIDSWERLPLFASQRKQAEPLREKQRLERESHQSEGLAWAMRTLGLGRMPSYWPALVDCPTPLCLLTGEQDEKYCRLAERVTVVAPAARHRVVPGVGHNIALEAPAHVAEELRALLCSSEQ